MMDGRILNKKRRYREHQNMHTAGEILTEANNIQSLSSCWKVLNDGVWIHSSDRHTDRLEKLHKTTNLFIQTIQFTEQVAGVQKSLEMDSKLAEISWAHVGYRHGLWNQIDLRLSLSSSPLQPYGFGKVS